MGQLYIKPEGEDFILANRVTVISDMSVASKDVNFYDGYGVRVAAYSFADAANMTVLPAFPVRSGISFTKWSKTISEVRAATEPLDVFAVGGSSDGKTKLFIAITSTLRATIPLYIQQSVSGGVTIDWGDGSATQTISGTGAVNTTHTYSAVGEYTISLAVTSGSLGFGNNSTASLIGGTNSGYRNALVGCIVGAGVTSIGYNALYECMNLEYCIIPQTVTSIGQAAFYRCYKLKFVGIPNEIVSMGGSTFSDCLSLKNTCRTNGAASMAGYEMSGCRTLENLVIPSAVTAIGTYAFSGNIYLKQLIIPPLVTSIGAGTFNVCSSLKKITFKPTTPPTVADSNAWTGVPADCVIEVPTANLSAYQAATNYGPIAAQMTGV